MNISHVVAFGKNRVIGKDNQLIWHLPADLRHFKEVTLGHHMVMGRKTWESIGRALPGRVSIVVTSDRNYKAEGAIVVHSIEDAIRAASGNSEICIIGGADIFRQTMDLATKLHITLIHEEFSGDVFYPEISADEWELVSEQNFGPDEKNIYSYTFREYKRRGAFV